MTVVGSTSHTDDRVRVVPDESPYRVVSDLGAGAPGMPSAPSNTPSSTAGLDNEPFRLMLKPDGLSGGYVDGGWWPYSRSLQAELPVLLDAMRTVGPPGTYHLGEWSDPPRRMIDHGVSIRLGGYHLQQPGSVDIIARNRRVTLLVVDPESPSPLASDALTASVDESNTENIADLLARTWPAVSTTHRVQE